MTYQQLAQLNGITNPNLIFPGQRLLIRSGNEPQPTPTSTQGATPTVQASPTAGGGTQQPTQTPTQQSATEAPTSVVVNTATPTPTQTATFTPTATLTPTATVVPTVDTFDGIPTPTPINPAAVIPPSAPNLLASASFEGSTREVVFPEIQVVDGWEPFYCDLPYTPQKCPALNQGSGNPQGLTMGRPSFTDTREAARVRSGTAQQWACPWKSCRGGVFQTIATTAGATCEVGAYVQSLSTGGTSMVSTVTDNSIWLIRVDLNGGTNAFAQGTHMLASRGFEFADGHYDQYVKITYTFQATGSQTTIFFENLRIWPIEVNQSFIDDAYVRCSS
jgi:LysM repeat protein